MKEYQLKKLLEDREEQERKIKEYLTEGSLTKQEKIEEEIQGHIQKAEHNLAFTQDTAKQGYSDWAVVGCYYTSYHIALALLLNKGFSSKNHDATLCVLIRHYYKKELSAEDLHLLNQTFLDNQDILFYVETKQEREKASYSTNTHFPSQLVEGLRIKTILFVNKCKEILNK